MIVNGTMYKDTTLKRVVDELETARARGTRVCIRYGDVKTGRDWGDPKMCGTVGRSSGSIKVPLLIKSSRSMGGESILDAHIVRITESRGGRVLYSHPSYTTSAEGGR